MAQTVPDASPNVNPVATSNVPRVMVAHPERWLILGSVWLAIASMGFVGASALVNPELKLPLIDPFLEAMARRGEKSAVEQGLRPFYPVVSEVQPLLPSPGAIASVEFIEVEVIETQTTETVKPSESVKTPAPVPVVQPQKQRGSHVPPWAYGIIIASCGAGSSLITYSLYRLNLMVAARRQGKPQRKRIKKTVAPVRRPVGQMSKATPLGKSVEAIAPLQIKTPGNVEPLQVQLEPVIDPQPVRKPISRAEQLVHLAQQAQQQQPKSLVELMDIRRRDRLAPFP